MSNLTKSKRNNNKIKKCNTKIKKCNTKIKKCNTKKKITIKNGGKDTQNITECLHEIDIIKGRDCKIYMIAYMEMTNNYRYIFNGIKLHTDFIVLNCINGGREYEVYQIFFGYIGVAVDYLFTFKYNKNEGWVIKPPPADSQDLQHIMKETFNELRERYHEYMYNKYKYKYKDKKFLLPIYDFRRYDKKNLGLYIYYGIKEILDRLTIKENDKLHAPDTLDSIKSDEKDYIISYNPVPNKKCEFYLFNLGIVNIQEFKNICNVDKNFVPYYNSCIHFTKNVIESYNKRKNIPSKLKSPFVSLTYAFITRVLIYEKKPFTAVSHLVPAFLSLLYYSISSDINIIEDTLFGTNYLKFKYDKYFFTNITSEKLSTSYDDLKKIRLLNY